MARYENGWVKIYRSLTSPQSDIGTNGYRLAIMVTLVAWANRDESTIQFNGKPRKIARGQVVIGLRDFAEHLKFSKDTVFRQLNYLCLRDTLRKEAATEGTLITILNYEDYQDNSEVPQQDCDKVATVAGHDTDRYPTASRTPNGEVKKRRSISCKVVGPISELAGIAQVDAALWKVSQDVQRLWLLTYPDADWVKREILKSLTWAANKRKTYKDYGRFFSTWLGNANFEPTAHSAPAGAPKCEQCKGGVLRAVNRSSGATEWCACTCAAGRAKTNYTRFDENRFERLGVAS